MNLKISTPVKNDWILYSNPKERNVKEGMVLMVMFLLQGLQSNLNHISTSLLQVFF